MKILRDWFSLKEKNKKVINSICREKSYIKLENLQEVKNGIVKKKSYININRIDKAKYEIKYNNLNLGVITTISEITEFDVNNELNVLTYLIQELFDTATPFGLSKNFHLIENISEIVPVI